MSIGSTYAEETMVFDRTVPYNDLPDLPPKVDIETTAILKMAIRANKALAELRISGHLIPGDVHLFGKFRAACEGASAAPFSSEIAGAIPLVESRSICPLSAGRNSACKGEHRLHFSNAIFARF